MKTIVAAAVLNAFAALGFIVVALPVHAAVPCEEMLKDMRAAKASAKLSDAEMKQVDDLETKAVERCNADDDTRSDNFLAEAMKIMGK
jgi:BarA-like signal transduction histidine kinase